MAKLLIKNASQLVTAMGTKAAFGRQMGDLTVIENAAIASDDGKITHVGKTEDVLLKLDENDYTVIDAQGKTITAGFIDSHTHFVFGGYRADEYNWRLNGESYVSIMEKGGGIVNSVRGTKEDDEQTLYDVGLKRLNSIMRFGVTTVEGKSGYGLYLDTELKQLKTYDALSKHHPLDIAITYLGPHAMPKDFEGDKDAFIDYQINECLPAVKALGYVEFADIFCEDKVFSLEQSERYLSAAKAMGFKLKMHADEIVPLGGAELGAKMGAVSADHLLKISDQGIVDMKNAGTVSTLLPATAFSLKEAYAPARKIIDGGGAVAVATDFNPGSCFTESIPLVIALSTLQMKMTIEEVITAITLNAAAALDRADSIGTLEVGKKADILIHEFPSYKFLPYHIGVSTVEMVIKSGEVAYTRDF